MSNLNSLSIKFNEVNAEEIRAEILVDGKPIVNSNYVLDLDELEKSLDYHGKFFILTCESNQADHINISKGIEINKDESENIKWKMADPENDVVYLFDSDEYRNNIINAVHSWKQIVSEKETKNQLSYQDIHSYVKYYDQDDEEDFSKN